MARERAEDGLNRRLRDAAPGLVALAAYGLLAALTVQAVGVVGEVAIGWALGSPPEALVQIQPPLWADGAADPTAGHRWGPLVASQVRPLEGLQLGPVSLPLAINRYTGGPPDWPARLVYALSGAPAAVTALHVLLGGVLLALVVRFVQQHAGRAAAWAAGLTLATDWGFVFYRKVLGGTELALLFGGLLALWGLWSRRWTGGRHGLLLLGLGAGLGLLGKVTFAIVLLALGLTAAAMRWDKGGMRPPLPRRPWVAALLVVGLTAPLWVAALHHGLAPEPPVQVRSHDFGGQQWGRVWNALTGGPAPAREGLGNLHAWALDPLSFFGVAYGAAVPAPSRWRPVGWALLAAGLLLAWRGRHPTPREALARFVSVLLPVQVLALLVVARDLHHLAQTAPLVALAMGLAADQLAGLRAPPRSPRRALWAVAFAAPMALGGVQALRSTDPVVQTIATPTFPAAGQLELVELLARHGVQRVVVADYESYGMLEVRAPDLQVEHTWPAFSVQGRDAVGPTVARAAGAHLLVVQASAPMIYNLRATEAQLQDAARAQGRGGGGGGGGGGGRATLYRVTPVP